MKPKRFAVFTLDRQTQQRHDFIEIESPSRRKAREHIERELPELIVTGVEPVIDFQLQNDPPKRLPAHFDNQDATKQRSLVDGMDCLPGQLDLF